MKEQLGEQNSDLQFSKDFEIAISSLFVNIPNQILKENTYSAKCMRNKDKRRIDISFHIEETSGDIQIVSEQIVKFIEFVNSRDLVGIIFDKETGVLTFDNAGYIAVAMQEYIDSNPDNLKNDLLNDLSDCLRKTFEDHAPELISQTHDDKSKLLYPKSAAAIVGGFISYFTFKNLEEIFGFQFTETESGGHIIKVVCPNMEGEDFPDPDNMDLLQNVYDDFAPIDVVGLKVKMNKNPQILEIYSANPLNTYYFLENIYKDNGMVGLEDVIENWTDDQLLKTLLGENGDEILSEKMERYDKKNYNRIRHQILSRYYKTMADSGLNSIQDNANDDGDELQIMPMGHYGSPSELFTSVAIGGFANCVLSLQEIEGKIRVETCQVTNPRQRRFTIH